MRFNILMFTRFMLLLATPWIPEGGSMASLSEARGKTMK
jgi:hypothetical protein